MHFSTFAGTLILGLFAGLTSVESVNTVFDSKADAEFLKTALKDKKGKDIIDRVIERVPNQRNEIAADFTGLYGEDLDEEVSSKIEKKLGQLVTALITPKNKYYSKELRRAITNRAESDLVEILCFLKNFEIKELNKQYKDEYGQSIKDALKENIKDDDFRKLLISVNSALRVESFKPALKTDAQNLAKKLLKAAAEDKALFNSILVSTDLKLLSLTIDEYNKISKDDIEKTISKSKFSDGAKKGFTAIVKRAKNAAEFYADQFYKSMDGAGTHDKDLVRLAVTYPKVHTKDIKTIYQKKYKRTLENDIKDDTSGDYKEGLLTLVK